MPCCDKVRRAPGTLRWIFGDRGCLCGWSVAQQCQELCHFPVKGPMLQYLGMLDTERMKLLGRQDEGDIRAGNFAERLRWEQCRGLGETQPTTSSCPWEGEMVESAEIPSRDQHHPPASSFGTNFISLIPSRSAVRMSIISLALWVK